jgi:hypothetical protein
MDMAEARANTLKTAVMGSNGVAVVGRGLRGRSPARRCPLADAALCRAREGRAFTAVDNSFLRLARRASSVLLEGAPRQDSNPQPTLRNAGRNDQRSDRRPSLLLTPAEMAVPEGERGAEALKGLN